MLGGAFNPPHTGHLLLAQEARWALELSEMVLMATGEAPHKEIEDDPGAEVRLEMTRLAAATSDGVEASDLEVERDGPSYAATLSARASRTRSGSGCRRWSRPEPC